MSIIKNSSGYELFLEKLITEQLEREIDLLQDSPNKRLEIAVLFIGENLPSHLNDANIDEINIKIIPKYFE